MITEKFNFLNLDFKTFLDVFKANLGKSEILAKLLYKNVMQKGNFNPSELFLYKHAPNYLNKVNDLFYIQNLELHKKFNENEAYKYVFKTNDNLFIESVIIPMKSYMTICISSQIGCRMGCVFCETGKMNLKRNLHVFEIVSQVYYLKFIEKINIRNIVFMGMGEPLDNLENVMKAIDIFTDDYGFNFKNNHITLSTCGIIPKIDAIKHILFKKCVFAVSINSADNELRSKIMPINKKYNLSDLKVLLLKLYENRKSRLFVEYVLIEGVNTSKEDADKLIDYCRNLPVRINLIPFNPGRKNKLKKPSVETVTFFHEYLQKAGLHVLERKSKGQNLMAACGQLGG